VENSYNSCLKKNKLFSYPSPPPCSHLKYDLFIMPGEGTVRKTVGICIFPHLWSAFMSVLLKGVMPIRAEGIPHQWTLLLGGVSAYVSSNLITRSLFGKTYYICVASVMTLKEETSTGWPVLALELTGGSFSKSKIF
jgi:hypothetical protein